MNQPTDDSIRELLRRAVPPCSVDGPAADLWPRVRRRIDREPARPPAGDWLLSAAVVLPCLFRPSLLEFLLLHF